MGSANLSEANLVRADLSGANLRDAYLWGAELEGAMGLNRCIFVSNLIKSILENCTGCQMVAG
ncbi:pentapeptide repeat-containing protein [Coleofasciculus sp. LEGE 07081]|uniref:pentapeptide repeat-containing protein n=1 Tax=unclassified Coleofasciculus TaxID=2692782 RepID=UPI0034DB6C7C